jgi:steroid delta-isomerase-like uncharacterized protein
MHEAQAESAVSPSNAKLPLRNPSAFSLKAKLHNRALRGEFLLGYLFSAGTESKPPVRRTGLHTQDRSVSKPRHSLQTRFLRELKSNFLERVTMSESNKAVVRRVIEEVWNKGNLQVADELFAPTYTHHDSSTPDVGRGPEGEKKRAAHYRNAFHDFRMNVEDLFSDGETVTARWTCRGNHKGELNGIAPTGKQFAITGITIARFTNGKITEGWVNWDALGLMQQLGVVPETGKVKAATR